LWCLQTDIFLIRWTTSISLFIPLLYPIIIPVNIPIISYIRYTNYIHPQCRERSVLYTYIYQLYNQLYYYIPLLYPLNQFLDPPFLVFTMPSRCCDAVTPTTQRTAGRGVSRWLHHGGISGGCSLWRFFYCEKGRILDMKRGNWSENSGFKWWKFRQIESSEKYEDFGHENIAMDQ